MDGELARLLDLHSSIQKFTPSDGKGERLKCSLTSHEMAPTCAAVSSYVKGKKYTKAKNQSCYSEWEPHIVPSQKQYSRHQLFCKLTLRHINWDSQSVKKHVAGKRFQRALKHYQHCKENNIEFKPFARQSRKKSGLRLSDQEGEGSDDNGEENPSFEDDMTDLYPPDDFNESLEEDDDVEEDEGKEEEEECKEEADERTSSNDDFERTSNDTSSKKKTKENDMDCDENNLSMEEHGKLITLDTTNSKTAAMVDPHLVKSKKRRNSSKDMEEGSSAKCKKN